VTLFFLDMDSKVPTASKSIGTPIQGDGVIAKLHDPLIEF
jgi:hypothetical protein